MIRTVLVALFYLVLAPFIALFGFTTFWLTGNIMPLYRMCMWTAYTGITRLGGIHVRVLGLEQLDRSRTYLYMANHVSNLDPPIVVPLVPPRTSVLVKRELFKVPLLGAAMKMGRLIPVDRSNREAAVQSIRAGAAVMREGISMTVFPEGTRSRDGRILPFKKGPFYLAMDTGFPIVPISIYGTETILRKGSAALNPADVTVVFHPPLETQQFTDRDALMNAVRTQIASALPEWMRDPSAQPLGVSHQR